MVNSNANAAMVSELQQYRGTSRFGESRKSMALIAVNSPAQMQADNRQSFRYYKVTVVRPTTVSNASMATSLFLTSAVVRGGWLEDEAEPVRARAYG